MQFLTELPIPAGVARRLAAAFLIVGFMAPPLACRTHRAQGGVHPPASSEPARSKAEVVTSSVTPVVASAPIDALDRFAVKSRLESAGFRVTDATETTSDVFHHLRLTAERGPVTLVVELYKPGDAYWKAHLKSKHAVVLSHGGELLGVIAGRNTQLARRVATLLARD